MKAVTVLLVLSCTLLMQSESIQFWMDATAHAGLFGWASAPVGVAWSLTIEATALWLWARNHTVLGVVASALVIAGPFFHLSKPITDAEQIRTQHVLLLAAAEQEVITSEKSLYQFLYNSNTRKGWDEHISRASLSLENARNKYRTLLEHRPVLSSWEVISRATYLGLVLLIAMLAQIMAIRFISHPAKIKHAAPDRSDVDVKPAIGNKHTAPEVTHLPLRKRGAV